MVPVTVSTRSGYPAITIIMGPDLSALNKKSIANGHTLSLSLYIYIYAGSKAITILLII